jgi:hypothetical protein
MKKLTFVFAFFSVFTFFISCQKEKVEIPSYLIGEWESVEQSTPTKLIIDKKNNVVFEKSSDRGMKFKIRKINIVNDDNYVYITLSSKERNISSHIHKLGFKYFFDSEIIEIYEQDLVDSNNVLFFDKGIILNRVL